MTQFAKPTKRRKKPIKIKNIIRDSVINRDKCCVLCGGKQEQIHHVMLKSHSGNNTSKNLVCVCNRCHLKIHANEKKYFTILFNILQHDYKDLKIEDMKK